MFRVGFTISCHTSCEEPQRKEGLARNRKVYDVTEASATFYALRVEMKLYTTTSRSQRKPGLKGERHHSTHTQTHTHKHDPKLHQLPNKPLPIPCMQSGALRAPMHMTCGPQRSTNCSKAYSQLCTSTLMSTGAFTSERGRSTKKMEHARADRSHPQSLIVLLYTLTPTEG